MPPGGCVINDLSIDGVTFRYLDKIKKPQSDKNTYY